MTGILYLRCIHKDLRENDRRIQNMLDKNATRVRHLWEEYTDAAHSHFRRYWLPVLL